MTIFLKRAAEGAAIGAAIVLVLSLMTTTISAPASTAALMQMPPPSVSVKREIVFTVASGTNITTTVVREDGEKTHIQNAVLDSMVAAMIELQLVTTNNQGEVMIETLEKAMRGIALVESGGHDMGIHKDGVSWGKYGVTMTAVAQLSKLGLISQEEFMEVQQSPKMIAEPERNERYARHYMSWQYVSHMKHDGSDRSFAVGRYHGGNEKRQGKYIERVVDALARDKKKPEPSPEQQAEPEEEVRK